MTVLDNASVVDGRFRIKHLLGSGGMGTVYLAEQLGFDRMVALKVLNQQLAGDAESLRRFEKEAQALSSLRHRHITMFYAYGLLPGGLPYIAMEYLSGSTLHEFIKKKTRLTWRETCSLGIQIADALASLHIRGIVHRDLKPENILLVRGENGAEHVKITDFGLSKLLATDEQQKLTKTGYALGTPFYMSPEQVGGLPLAPAADIYAFGCVLYECLAGHPPFLGTSSMEILYKHTTDPVPLLGEPTGNDALDKLISLLFIAMEKDQAKRMITAEDFSRGLNDLVSSQSPDCLVPARCFKKQAGASSPVRKSPKLLAILASAACVILAAAVCIIRSTKSDAGIEKSRDGSDPNIKSSVYYLTLAKNKMSQKKPPAETLELLRKAQLLINPRTPDHYVYEIYITLSDQLNVSSKSSADKALDEAIGDALEAQAHTKKLPYNEERSTALAFLGALLSKKKNWAASAHVIADESLPYEQLSGINTFRISREARSLIEDYRQLAQYQRAIDTYKKYANIIKETNAGGTDLDDLHRDLGASYFSLNQASMALQQYESIVEPDATDTERRAQCYQELGQNDEALDLYRTLFAKTDPQHTEAHALLMQGRYLAWREHFPDGAKYLELCLTKNPSPQIEVRAQYYLAHCYQHMGRLDEATELCNQVLANPAVDAQFTKLTKNKLADLPHHKTSP